MEVHRHRVRVWSVSAEGSSNQWGNVTKLKDGNGVLKRVICLICIFLKHDLYIATIQTTFHLLQYKVINIVP